MLDGIVMDVIEMTLEIPFITQVMLEKARLPNHLGPIFPCLGWNLARKGCLDHWPAYGKIAVMLR